MLTRVLVVDDHQLFREGLCAMLETQPELEVVGEANDAPSAYAEVAAKQPDVVVMDVSLPGTSGIVATRELVRRDPERRVLLLSMHGEEDVVVEGLAAGALGFAMKAQPAREVVLAIGEVARGRPYLATRLQRARVEEGLRRRRAGGGEGVTRVLSQREREVFDLLVLGLSNEAIARQLDISAKTVETHRAHVLKKLGLHSVVELVRFAARHDLLTA
jgi:two-component system response regulator NreC